MICRSALNAKTATRTITVGRIAMTCKHVTDGELFQIAHHACYSICNCRDVNGLFGTIDVRNGSSPRMMVDIRACQKPASSWCTGKRQIGFQALLQDLTVPATCFIICQRDCSTSTSNLLCPVWNKGSGLRAVLRPDLILQTDITSLINYQAATMPSSAPQSPTPYNDAPTRPDYSADYSTLASSSRELPTSAPIPVRREPLAFAGIRHRMEEDEAARVGTEARHSELSNQSTCQALTDVAIGQCTQVVMISCLHLALEAAHPLGRFAWTLPNAKEPAETTLRIMRRRSSIWHTADDRLR